MKHHVPDETFIKLVIFVSTGICMIIDYFMDDTNKK
ncbi:MAG: hypothetical protein RL728_73 [Bacteroidota bacterium]|jgi:hypothetical protein